MKYRVFGDTILVRIDRGEEILSCVQKVCEKEQIFLGSVTALAACDHVVIGLYSVAEQKFLPTALDGEMEMTGLTGTIAAVNGKPQLHFHASFADREKNVFGGHLNEAVVSGTCELFIHRLNGIVGRYHDEETGLNLLDL